MGLRVFWIPACVGMTGAGGPGMLRPGGGEGMRRLVMGLSNGRAFVVRQAHHERTRLFCFLPEWAGYGNGCCGKEFSGFRLALE